MSLNNEAEAKNAVNEEKGSIIKESAQESGKVKAVVKDKFAEEKKKKSPAVNVHGLGLGIAGTGNSP